MRTKSGFIFLSILFLLISTSLSSALEKPKWVKSWDEFAAKTSLEKDIEWAKLIGSEKN